MMFVSTPENLHDELERLFRQAADMLIGSPAESELGIRLMNQLAIAAESMHTRRRATDATTQKPPVGSSGNQYCSARR